MNAYEDADGNVVVDVCRYERMFDLDSQDPFGDGIARLDRWTVNPNTRKVSETCIDERGVEFPRCHPALSGKPYRFGYSVAVAGEGFPAINKHDLHTGWCTRHELGAGRHSRGTVLRPARARERARGERP
jgi:8'-apo-carotenoid 13,14-cleaving dioxygenase